MGFFKRPPPLEKCHTEVYVEFHGSEHIINGPTLATVNLLYTSSHAQPLIGLQNFCWPTHIHNF